MPNPAELDAYYERSYRSGSYADFVGAQEIRRAIAEYRLGRVRPDSRPTRWLDVGCAAGDFLEAGRKAGLNIEGLDRSAEAVSRVRSRGLVAYSAQVEEFEPEHPYDFITAFDVLEHSRDPRTFIRCCHSWLASQGTLVLTLPDVNSIYPRLLMRKHWFFYNPQEHLYYFNRKTIRRLMSEEGFFVIRMERTYKPLSLLYAATALRSFNPVIGRVACSIAAMLPEGLVQFRWRLYLGEMLIEARRS